MNDKIRKALFGIKNGSDFREAYYLIEYNSKSELKKYLKEVRKKILKIDDLSNNQKQKIESIFLEYFNAWAGIN